MDKGNRMTFEFSSSDREDKEYEEGVFCWKHGQHDNPYDPWLYPAKCQSWNRGYHDMARRVMNHKNMYSDLE